MKSSLNFTVKHESGATFDMHELGLWVESFHIYAPNAIRKLAPHENGARLKKSKLGIRRVDTTIQVESNSMIDFDQKKHLIYSIFFTDQPFEIVRDLTPGKRIFVLYEGEYDIRNISNADGDFKLELVMIDPYIYGETHDLTLGSSYDTYAIQGLESPWTSRTTFAGSTSQYTLETNEGGKIVLDYNFIAGDVLEIDYRKRKVTLNGASIAVAINMETRWFTLTPGYMALKSSHTTTLSYTERNY